MTESLYSRAPNPERLFGEVRPLVPVEVLNVLDAVCISDGEARGRKMSRDEKINQILLEWAIRTKRQASVVMNVTRGNPDFADSNVGGL
jgi:hypothetical protein